jgi:hypothetical protein
MTRDKIPIDETHAANVEARLARLRAAGPAPRKTWTRQALVARVDETLTAMRAEGFSLEEIADAMSHNGVTFSAEMLSSYLSRQRHGTAGNGVTARARPRKASTKPSSPLAPTTKRKTSPPRDTTRDAGDGRTDAADLVATDLPPATAQGSHDPELPESKDQGPAPLNIGGAATTKLGKGWLNTIADRRNAG